MPLHSVPFEDLPPNLQRLQASAQQNGQESKLIGVMANAPHLHTFYFDQFYGDVFNRGVAPQPIKELVRLRLSHLHGCAT